jgi:hypothetical protein
MAAKAPKVASEGRLAERAAVLTVGALVLLAPPILTIFDVPVLVFGIPLLHVYCFTVWLAAIACGCWLASRMGGEATSSRPGSQPGDGG